LTDRGQEAPKVFVSYSWDDDGHRDWVRDLASRLRSDGVDAGLRRWKLALGDQLPEFMERAVRENDFVLIVCTPRYKERADGRVGGVGYEGDIMTAEVLSERRQRKFIPVLRAGDWSTALPSWLLGKLSIDLRGDPYPEERYRALLDALLGRSPQAPPLGRPPAARGPRTAPEATAPEPRSERSGLPTEATEPIRIVGVVENEVTFPRNDGTRGSALYAVPFRLSRRPSGRWSELFVRIWNHPPSFTTMHRPGIARVAGDRIVLDGTTMDEVERYHLKTLKLALQKTNEEAEELQRAERARLEKRRDEEEAHRRGAEDSARRLRFD
jgi:hypothetical protein